ncbi:MAG: SPOR domain-containing protein [Caulobacteraceae bacterium]
MADPHRSDSDRYDSGRPLTFRSIREERPRRPPPTTLIASLVVLVVVVAGGGFLLYRHGVRGPSDAPRPLGAPINDIRTIAPPPPPSDDGAGLSIYKANPETPPAPTFAPPPESPAARTPVASQPLSPAAGPEASKTVAPEAQTAEAAPPERSEDAVAAIAEGGALKGALPPKASRKPEPKEQAPEAEAVAANPQSGDFAVQIGAFSSPAEAERGWEKAAAAAPGAMAGKGKQVARLDRAGKVLYRTAITGFTTRAQAQALCAHLKASGGSCFVR